MNDKIGLSLNRPNTKSLTAIYYYDRGKVDAISNLAKFTDIDIANSKLFSPWGESMRSEEAFEDNAHYLAPLNNKFKRAYVFYRAIPLPSGIPLYALLGMMLIQMGEGSEIYIQVSKDASSINPCIDIQQLQKSIPSAAFEELDGDAKGWFCLRWSEELRKDIKNFDTTYPRLLQFFDLFEQKMNAIEPNSGERNFIYSLHWALQSRSIMQAIFDRFNKKGLLRGLDIGGSSGFLTCELASMGHRITNFELNSPRVEYMFPWLAETCEVSDLVNARVKRMEDLRINILNRILRRGRFDFICFMGSLLLCEREKVAHVLQQAKAMLKKDGFIILRENLNHDKKVKNNNTFTFEELNAYLENIGDKILYYNHYGKELETTKAKNSWMLYAVIQKGKK